MKKRYTFVLAQIVLSLLLVPLFVQTAHAASSDAVYVNGLKMASGTYWKNGDTKKLTGSAADYNAYYKSGTLYLKDAVLNQGKSALYMNMIAMSGEIYADHDIKVRLSGTNTMNVVCGGGIFVRSGSLNLGGDGTLNITGERFDRYVNEGIFVQENVTISDCTIQESQVNYGIFGDKTVTVMNANILTSAVYGIWANQELTIGSGNVDIQCTTRGLYGARRLSISGGRVNVNSGSQGLRGASIVVMADPLITVYAKDGSMAADLLDVEGIPVAVGTDAAHAQALSVQGNEINPPYAIIGQPVQNLCDGSMQLSAHNYVYNGKAKKPSVTVKYGTKALKEGTDYTVSYSNNKEIGTANALVCAANGSSSIGMVKQSFAIRPPAPKISAVKNTASGVSMQWNAVSDATGYNIYRKMSGETNWKKVKTVSADTTSWVNQSVSNGRQYTYAIKSYANATQSQLSAEKTVYRIKTPSISGLTNGSGKKMTVKWGTNSAAEGYRLAYSLSQSFSNAKTVSISSWKTGKKTLSGLSKNKTYYVRVCAYKTVDGAAYDSAWSAVKKIKITR